jgi:RNA polymerase sigma-70 factor, ECF subfamily
MAKGFDEPFHSWLVMGLQPAAERHIVTTPEELANRLQMGDRDALAALVEGHHHALVGYLFRMTGGERPLAEDLTQEAFMRVLRAISQYRYPQPFKPWLYAIATNLARDHYKRAETRAARPLPEDDLLSDDEPLEDMQSADEDAQRVIWALQNLPAHQRETVVLRYYQGLSMAEIAEALSIPVGTVKSRLSIGLGQLRQIMEQV